MDVIRVIDNDNKFTLEVFGDSIADYEKGKMTFTGSLGPAYTALAMAVFVFLMAFKEGWTKKYPKY